MTLSSSWDNFSEVRVLKFGVSLRLVQTSWSAPLAGKKVRGHTRPAFVKRFFTSATLSACLIWSICAVSQASVAVGGTTVKITIHPEKIGLAIPPDYTGLSFEARLLLPAENGQRYFRPDNQPLINLFRTLGIRNLRIGGNTSDRDAGHLPSEPDLDSLFGFVKAAGAKVIYCLRLHKGDPQAAAATVKYVMDRYAPLVDCFSIGQEPSAYPVEKVDTRAATERMGAAAEKYKYENYREDWKRFSSAIIAAVPDVKFCVPSVHNNGEWARRFMQDFGKGNHVSLITEHLYPGGAGGKVPTPEIGRERMLGESFVQAYEKLCNSFAPIAATNGLPYRMEEVNNYYNGGATNVSNTFASALWGLDFMYWWAAHNAAGLNFHTGDKVAAGPNLLPSKYTAFFSTTNGYLVRPLGYGIKAFELGSRGKLVSVTISDSQGLNLNAYGVLGDDATFYLTIINQENGARKRDADVEIATGPAFTQARMVTLSAPDNDIAATSDVKLGGAEIKSDGTWAGGWTSLPARRPCVWAMNIPAASAVVVNLTTK